MPCISGSSLRSLTVYELILRVSSRKPKAASQSFGCCCWSTAVEIDSDRSKPAIRGSDLFGEYVESIQPVEVEMIAPRVERHGLLVDGLRSPKNVEKARSPK